MIKFKWFSNYHRHILSYKPIALYHNHYSIPPYMRSFGFEWALRVGPFELQYWTQSGWIAWLGYIESLQHGESEY